MPLFLSRLLARFALLTSWFTPVIVIVVVFATSWPLMALAEPEGSALVQPQNYWWYFVVTAATVGYGDFFPESAAGHLVGAYVIIGGIVTLTTVFTKMASVLEGARGRRMQGSITVKASGHTVLLGYTPGRTERIAREVLHGIDGTLVLCAWDEVGTHPMPEDPVEFVRGDLTDEETLRRAGVQTAHAVLVDARDDNEALAVALAVDHVATDAHVVVTLRDMERASLLGYVDDHIRCVQWHTPRMITEELTSPGIAEMYAELMTHGGANTYSVTLPESLGPVPVDRCRVTLGRRHGVTVLAARAGERLVVNPGWGDELPAGAVLYYVSAGPLTSEQVEQALRQDGADRS
ncbi:K+ transport system, NAD-binding component [Saccharomonospora marina XMU15]|uniref:K+ transport system, NAD-binding component n=1 Tax=Saccharomonospora marina XMU15 TaxID=882083 RepID=H5WZ04_9PSEU|nr:ion channel [Saccharomonospora marina]EHR52938.1 K+ transport system, NAD-binding component [Saccharomonospora marina XMU15]